MTSYAPLEHFLATQTRGRLRLSFNEVERVLGAPLPPSARRHQPWWANSQSHSQARAWMRRGWRTEAVDVAGERLTFVRDTAPREPGPARRGLNSPKSDAPDLVIVNLEELGPAAKRYLPEIQARFGVDLAEAIPLALELAGRRALIDQVAGVSPMTQSNSADLIREMRDER